MVDRAQQLFDELRRHLPGSEHLPNEQARAALRSALGKLDLVTRDEFDAQAAVLAHTRERLEKLETKLAELEDERSRS